MGVTANQMGEKNGCWGGFDGQLSKKICKIYEYGGGGGGFWVF